MWIAMVKEGWWALQSCPIPLDSQTSFCISQKVNNSSRGNESDHEIIGNRIYKYDFVNNTLVNPKLILHIPSNDFPVHIGGKIIIGPDKNLYIAVGDLYAKNATTQNIVNGTPVDGSGGILRIYHLTYIPKQSSTDSFSYSDQIFLF
jgi:hypothetical protein